MKVIFCLFLTTFLLQPASGSTLVKCDVQVEVLEVNSMPTEHLPSKRYFIALLLGLSSIKNPKNWNHRDCNEFSGVLRYENAQFPAMVFGDEKGLSLLKKGDKFTLRYSYVSVRGVPPFPIRFSETWSLSPDS